MERGINWIATAPIYGMGHSERVVARALKELGSAQRPLVFSKCSIVWDEEKNVGHSLKGASIRKEVEDSLQRYAEIAAASGTAGAARWTEAGCGPRGRTRVLQSTNGGVLYVQLYLVGGKISAGAQLPSYGGKIWGESPTA